LLYLGSFIAAIGRHCTVNNSEALASIVVATQDNFLAATSVKKDCVLTCALSHDFPLLEINNFTSTCIPAKATASWSGTQ
jgi:hypothetical protein